MKAHRRGDAHLDYAADHHPHTARVGQLGRVKCGGGPAKFGVSDVEDGSRPVRDDRSRVGNGADGLVRCDIDLQGTDQLMQERGGGRR